MKVKYVKISDAIYLLAKMLNRNIYFTDMYMDSDGRLIFTPSKIPSKNEADGDGIINTINFDEDEED